MLILLTRVSLPVKVILGVAMALQVQSCLLTRWAVSERNVVVSDVIEEVDFLFLEEKASSNRMDWCVTPPLIEESSILIKRLEEVRVSLGAEPIKVTNFEVGPLDTISKFFSSEQIHHTIWQ